MSCAIEVPKPETTDVEAVATALEAASALGTNGNYPEALRYLRRAVESASENGDDLRALKLARAAAELSDYLEGSSVGGGSPADGARAEAAADAQASASDANVETKPARRLPSPPPRVQLSCTTPLPPRSSAPSAAAPAAAPTAAAPTAAVPPKTMPPRRAAPRSMPPRSMAPRSVPPRSVPPRSVPPRSVPPEAAARSTRPPRSQSSVTSSATRSVSPAAPRSKTSEVPESVPSSRAKTSDGVARISSAAPRVVSGRTPSTPPPKSLHPGYASAAVRGTAKAQLRTATSTGYGPSRQTLRVCIARNPDDPETLLVRPLEEGVAAPPGTHEALIVLLDPHADLQADAFDEGKQQAV